MDLSYEKKVTGRKKYAKSTERKLATDQGSHEEMQKWIPFKWCDYLILLNKSLLTLCHQNLNKICRHQDYLLHKNLSGSFKNRAHYNLFYLKIYWWPLENKFKQFLQYLGLSSSLLADIFRSDYSLSPNYAESVNSKTTKKIRDKSIVWRKGEDKEGVGSL